MRDWRAIIAARFAETDTGDPATSAEIIDEIAQHFEQRERELRRSGAPDASVDARLEQELNELDPEVVLAIRVSQARAGNPAAVEGATFGGWVDGLARDVTVAWRSLRRTPGVTSVIIASLAVALGANTAIFSLTDAMYLRRLDVPHAEQLVRVDALRDGRPWLLPYSAFRGVRSTPTVPKVAGFRFEGVVATTGSGDERRFWLDMVTGEFFDLVGIAPLVGRTITAADEQSAAHVIVVSETYWRQHLGARPDVLGQVLRMNDTPFTIVGVMPSRYHGLHFAHQFQAAAPFTVSLNGFANTASLATSIVARLDVRKEPEPQRAAMAAAVQACCAQGDAPYRGDERRATNLRVVFPDDPPYGDSDRRADAAKGLAVQLTDASRGLQWGRDLRNRYRAAVIGMVAAVVLLLLIACANVATLLLVRGELRAREFAIRRSLGASAGRVRLQLFVEALELCVVGAAVGVPFAWMITTLLARALPPSAQALGDVIAWRENGRVIAITLGITALCAIATSLWPAWRAGREELATTLSGTRARGGRRSIGQRVLAIGQISAAMVLITAALLFVATMRNLTRTAGGYGSRDVLLAQVNARDLPDSGATRNATIETLRYELQQLTSEFLARTRI